MHADIMILLVLIDQLSVGRIVFMIMTLIFLKTSTAPHDRLEQMAVHV
jgi:hypothetical protein